MNESDVTAEDVLLSPEDAGEAAPEETAADTEETTEEVRDMVTEGLTMYDFTGFSYILSVPASNELSAYDIYILQVKQYNLSLLTLWVLIGMFVICRVFEAFKPAYKVSKE